MYFDKFKYLRGDYMLDEDQAEKAHRRDDLDAWIHFWFYIAVCVAVSVVIGLSIR